MLRLSTSLLNSRCMSISLNNTKILVEPIREIISETRNRLSSLFEGLILSRTYRPHFKKRKRTHGFLNRIARKSGRNIHKRRVAKKRRTISV